MNAETGFAFDTQLQQVLLKVARRADQLARRSLATPVADRHLWLRAELEVFEDVARSGGAPALASFVPVLSPARHQFVT